MSKRKPNNPLPQNCWVFPQPTHTHTTSNSFSCWLGESITGCFLFQGTIRFSLLQNGVGHFLDVWPKTTSLRPKSIPRPGLQLQAWKKSKLTQQPRQPLPHPPKKKETPHIERSTAQKTRAGSSYIHKGRFAFILHLCGLLDTRGTW